MTASVQPSVPKAGAFQLFSSAKRKRHEPGVESQPVRSQKASRKKLCTAPHLKAVPISGVAIKRREGPKKDRGEDMLGNRNQTAEAASVDQEAVLDSGDDAGREDGAVGRAEPGGEKQATLDAAREGDEGPTFRDLGLSDWLCRVCESLGMKQPTQVQTGCIPAILAGRDVVGTAHTGSGKTAAFALPILQLLAPEPFGVFALILTPTRELAVQIGEQFRAFASGMSFQDAVVIGGMDMSRQTRELSSRPHVVVATPGRLRDLLQQQPALGNIFKRTRFLVLDEADRILDPTFESELRVIGATLPSERQTLLFSATMTHNLEALRRASLQDAHTFQAYEGMETADNLREEYLFLPEKVKDVYVVHLLARLAERSVRSTMVFVSRRRTAHLLSLLLDEMDISAATLHSGLAQGARMAALDQFKSGRVDILLATDVASRGLDIPTVDLVLNYDLPVEPRDYVHRVGRTARAGRSGWALTVVTQYDVQLLRTVENVIGHQLTELKMDEGEVLKGMTKVYKAKRTALVRAQENALRAESAGRPDRMSRGSKKKIANV